MVNLQDDITSAKIQNINDTYIQRFSHLAEAFRYHKSTSDIVEFCLLVKTNPDEFKNIQLITSKWRKLKSLSKVLQSIKTISALPIIKDAMGDNYDDILQKHENFRLHMFNLLKSEEKKVEKVEEDDDKDFFPQQQDNSTTQNNKQNFYTQENEVESKIKVDDNKYKKIMHKIQRKLNRVQKNILDIQDLLKQAKHF